jgi:hypothetical protein
LADYPIYWSAVRAVADIRLSPAEFDPSRTLTRGEAASAPSLFFCESHATAALPPRPFAASADTDAGCAAFSTLSINTLRCRSFSKGSSTTSSPSSAQHERVRRLIHERLYRHYIPKHRNRRSLPLFPGNEQRHSCTARAVRQSISRCDGAVATSESDAGSVATRRLRCGRGTNNDRSRRVSRVARCATNGAVSTQIVAHSAAATILAPATDAPMTRAAISVAVVRARSGSREPMTTG